MPDLINRQLRACSLGDVLFLADAPHVESLQPQDTFVDITVEAWEMVNSLFEQSHSIAETYRYWRSILWTVG